MNHERDEPRAGRAWMVDRRPVMSLLRQLWVSVVVAMAVVLSGAFGISLITARNYFEQQLLAQANDRHHLA